MDRKLGIIQPTKNPDGSRGSVVGRVMGGQSGIYTRF